MRRLLWRSRHSCKDNRKCILQNESTKIWTEFSLLRMETNSRCLKWASWLHRESEIIWPAKWLLIQGRPCKMEWYMPMKCLIYRNNNFILEVLFQFLSFSYLRRRARLVVSLHICSTEYETLTYGYFLFIYLQSTLIAFARSMSKMARVSRELTVRITMYVKW